MFAGKLLVLHMFKFVGYNNNYNHYRINIARVVDTTRLILTTPRQLQKVIIIRTGINYKKKNVKNLFLL